MIHQLIPLIPGKANQPHNYFSHRQRPPRESCNQQPKPHHILTQTLERLAGSDKTCLTLTSTLASVSRAPIYTPNKTQDEAGGRDTVAMIPHTKCLVFLRTRDTHTEPFRGVSSTLHSHKIKGCKAGVREHSSET